MSLRFDDGVSFDRVTILMALELEDGLVLASDSATLLTDEKGRVEAQQAMPKIWSHPACSDLVWGFTGDGAVGSQFCDWLRGESPDAWDALLASAGEKLVRLNKAGKRLARLAGAVKQFDAVEVMIAGYLEEKRDSKVALISAAGGAYPYERGLLAVASSEVAQTAALTAWAAVQKLAPDAPAMAAFVRVLEATIATIPTLGGDVQLKHVPAARD